MLQTASDASMPRVNATDGDAVNRRLFWVCDRIGETRDRQRLCFKLHIRSQQWLRGSGGFIKGNVATIDMRGYGRVLLISELNNMAVSSFRDGSHMAL